MNERPSAARGEATPFEAVPVRFVLVEPLSAGNVGSVARALKNFGFGQLALVHPRCDVRGRQARAMAVDAVDVLEGATVHPGLDEALAGARTVVGTSRRGGKHRRPRQRLDAFSGELRRLAAAGDLAAVFGREDRGLTDAEVDRCTHLVHLPAAAECPSLNLAQAVLLVAWELRRGRPGGTADEPLDPPAPHDEREAMYRHLEQALLAIGFLRPGATVSMMRRLRRLIGRASPTAGEVRILRGVAQQVSWVARSQGARDGSDER